MNLMDPISEMKNGHGRGRGRGRGHLPLSTVEHGPSGVGRGLRRYYNDNRMTLGPAPAQSILQHLGPPQSQFQVVSASGGSGLSNGIAASSNMLDIVNGHRPFESHTVNSTGTIVNTSQPSSIGHGLSQGPLKQLNKASLIGDYNPKQVLHTFYSMNAAKFQSKFTINYYDAGSFKNHPVFICQVVVGKYKALAMDFSKYNAKGWACLKIIDQINSEYPDLITPRPQAPVKSAFYDELHRDPRCKKIYANYEDYEVESDVSESDTFTDDTEDEVDTVVRGTSGPIRNGLNSNRINSNAPIRNGSGGVDRRINVSNRIDGLEEQISRLLDRIEALEREVRYLHSQRIKKDQDQEAEDNEPF